MTKIVILQAQIESAKKALNRQLPGVKHTHRLEAAARGLRFNTYASLIAKLNSAGFIEAVVDEDRFDAYLLEKGFGDLSAVTLADTLRHFAAPEGPAA